VARVPRQVGGHHFDDTSDGSRLGSLRAERLDLFARYVAATLARCAGRTFPAPELEREALTVRPALRG
jgi:hypothetical protein